MFKGSGIAIFICRPQTIQVIETRLEETKQRLYIMCKKTSPKLTFSISKIQYTMTMAFGYNMLY